MAVQTLYDSGSTYDIPATYDGAVYNAAVSDCICKGVGDEFRLHTNDNSLDVTFTAGSEAVIGGGFFKVVSDTSKTLDPNRTIYLCASINLANGNGERGVFVQRGSQAAILKGNLNGGDSMRDMLLYVITTSATSITSVQDMRVIKGDGGASVSGVGLTLSSQFLTAETSNDKLAFRVISESDYNSLETKDNNTLYFIPEG